MKNKSNKFLREVMKENSYAKSMKWSKTKMYETYWTAWAVLNDNMNAGDA
jgi:hypothetical protein